MSKPIGTYLGDGKIELNDYGIEKLIVTNIPKGKTISETELLKKINKKLELNKGGKKWQT